MAGLRNTVFSRGMETEMAGAGQPYYTVQLDMSSCVYDIRVNDAPLFESVEGLPVVVEVPANRWIRNGANEVSVRLRPLPGKSGLDGAKCSAVVYVRESGGPRESRREVGRLEYPGTSLARQDDGASVVSAPFTATVPFPLFRWFTAAEVGGADAVLAELMRELAQFHSLLSLENMGAILSALRERDREDAAASYQTVEEQTADTRKVFEDLFDKSRYVLRPLRTKEVRLRVFARGRLARVDLVSNGQSPIYYLTHDRHAAGYVTLLFCRDSMGKWVVIR